MEAPANEAVGGELLVAWAPVSGRRGGEASWLVLRRRNHGKGSSGGAALA